ncbi:MAG: pyridoxamine 5'-phosphate oxidase family protein [Candidatus Omnitrophica bacterium]|nr:pyridoxamine 5'-phosphate oxidase family protein [Candidatus Omnitrophota bacterium]
MLIEKVNKVLQGKEFIPVATSSPEGRPNSAPKLFIKSSKGFLYFADYVIGKTWENLSVNPFVSISFMDFENLTGYQIKGSVTLLTSGNEFEAIRKELAEKELSLTSKRIVEGVRRGKAHANFAASFPDNGVVIKVKVEEAVEITPEGKLKKEKLS